MGCKIFVCFDVLLDELKKTKPHTINFIIFLTNITYDAQ